MASRAVDINESNVIQIYEKERLVQVINQSPYLLYTWLCHVKPA
jgi:hypothetical protein